jgi:hypothetical protein
VFGHRFGIGAAIAGDWNVDRQRIQVHEVDPGGEELDQAGRPDVIGLAGTQILVGIAGQDR